MSINCEGRQIEYDYRIPRFPVGDNPSLIQSAEKNQKEEGYLERVLGAWALDNPGVSLALKDGESTLLKHFRDKEGSLRKVNAAWVAFNESQREKGEQTLAASTFKKYYSGLQSGNLFNVNSKGSKNTAYMVYRALIREGVKLPEYKFIPEEDQSLGLGRWSEIETQILSKMIGQGIRKDGGREMALREIRDEYKRAVEERNTQLEPINKIPLRSDAAIVQKIRAMLTNTDSMKRSSDEIVEPASKKIALTCSYCPGRIWTDEDWKEPNLNGLESVGEEGDWKHFLESLDLGLKAERGF